MRWRKSVLSLAWHKLSPVQKARAELIWRRNDRKLFGKRKAA